MEKQRRVAEYFVIAGLPDNPQLLEEEAGGSGHSYAQEPVKRSSAGRLEPITDICIIFPSEGELCPPGYKLLACTPGGLPADLNHGSIRSPEVFLCYRKGRDKPPLTDLGVLYEGKERVLPGCEVIFTTPYGRCANVNNSNSNRIYLTYRRAPDNAASDTLAVTDICVIVTSKGETPPHSYCLINRNLNKGTMVGSSVYLCYKKSVSKACTIVYRPGLLDRYPLNDYDGFPLPSLLPMFAMPMGAVLESWPEKAEHPKPVFSSFVLTGVDGEKVYGAAVSFYEPFPVESLKSQQVADLGLASRSSKSKSVHVNKAICIVSRWPFFDAYRRFLFFLRSQACRPLRPAVPIERYIEHFMFDVPFPSQHRPRIMVQLANEFLLLTQPDDSPIPLSGASFLSMLRNLGAEKCMNVLTYVLMEHKLVVHSLRPAVLTVVIEAIGSMIFPFRWRCPYIPLCPLELSGVLSAPTPFIVGIDSQYFDISEPPPDITCVDLDTGTVLQPEDKKAIDHKLLPKRPAKVLKATLEAVSRQLLEAPASAGSAPDGTGIDFKLKQREMSMENAVQEAFLRFMAAILKGYRSYLLPITAAPSLVATSAHTLFDMKGFLKSRDGAYHKFFAQMLSTQLFFGFVEERSFNSKREVTLAFFDECTEKVDENVDTPRLLEADSKGEHTVFITPPEATGNMSPTKESVAGLSPTADTAGKLLQQSRAATAGCFPMLNHDLLKRAAMQSVRADVTTGGAKDSSLMPVDGYVAKRTKAEVKLAQKVAVDCKTSYSSLQWAKCLLSAAYSVWFVQLPALTELAPAPRDALRAALSVLRAMREQRLHTPDEVCYRALMQLCGLYQQPVLAVQTLYEMRQHGLSPNAVTYGVYNQAVLESKWPSTYSTANVMWRHVRHAIEAVARFRRPLLRRAQHSELVAALSTASLASMASDVADGDTHSHGSIDSEDLLSVSSAGLSAQQYILHSGVEGRGAASKSKEPELLSTGSDMGYNSTSTEDSMKTSVAQELEHPLTANLSVVEAAVTAKGSTNETVESLLERKAARGKLEPKTLPVTADDPLGLFSLRGGSVTHLTPAADCREAAAALSGLSKAKPEQKHSMDIQGLFGRSVVAASDPFQAARSRTTRHAQPLSAVSAEDISKLKTHSYANAELGRSVSCLPSEEDGCGSESGVAVRPVKKSDSLDSRLSTSSTSSSGGSAAVADTAGGSNDRLAGPSSSAAVVKGLASKMLKSLLPKAGKNHGAMVASRESLTADSTDSPQQQQPGTAAQRQREGSPRRPAVPRALGVVSALKRSGSISNRLATVTNVVTTKLQDKYNSLVQTVMEIQAPSTITMAARSQHDGGKAGDSGAGNAGQPSSLAASHNTVLPPDGNSIGSDQLSLSEHRNDSIADSMDEYFSAMDDREAAEQNSVRGNTGPVSPSFAGQYTPCVSISHTAPSDALTCSFDHQDDAGRCANTSHIIPGLAGALHCSCQKASHRDTDALIEIEMCSVNECSSCGSLIYDEEIMAGWSADDSNLNTTCAFCNSKHVPFLSINVKNLRAVPCQRCHKEETWCAAEVHNGSATEKTDAKQVAGESCSNNAEANNLGQPSSPSQSSAPTSAPVVTTASVPYLSPLVLRKELENVLDVEGDQCLCVADFVDQHPIIYWNMVWLFRRLNLVSHLPGFALTAKGCGVNAYPAEKYGTKGANREAGLDNRSTEVAPHGVVTPKSDASSVLVRAVWDSSCQPTGRQLLGKPMYVMWAATKHSGQRGDISLPPQADVHANVSEEDFAKIVMQQIIRGIESNDMHAPILLLLEHRQHQLEAAKAGRASTANAAVEPAPHTVGAASDRTKFRSTYREMLFLGFIHFGKDFLEHDAFDREYKHAFKQLSAEQRSLLQRSDYPPSPAVMWCRKLFGQLEVY